MTERLDAEFPPYPPTKYVTGIGPLTGKGMTFNKEVPSPDAAPPKEPLCQTCGQDWDADEAAERCTYPECPYGDTTVWGGERAAPPSDAAPVALTQKLITELLWDMPRHNMELGTDVSDNAVWLYGKLCEALYAHPEDAPGVTELHRWWEAIRVCVVVDKMLPPISIMEKMQNALPSLDSPEDAPGGPLDTERLAREMAGDPDAPVCNLMIDTMEAWILRALNRLKGETDG